MTAAATLPSAAWLRRSLAAVSVFVASSAAMAAGDVGPAADRTEAARSAPTRTLPLFAAPRAGLDALATQRGGAQVAAETTLRGSVADNQAVNVATGGNSIGGGAFSGMSGVPVVIQNSGNNVLIQSATVINLQLK